MLYYYDITLPTYNDYLDMLKWIGSTMTIFKTTHWNNNSATVYVFSENHDAEMVDYLTTNILTYTRTVH